MTYFDNRLTDADLLRAASVMQSTPIRTLAQRLQERGAIVGRVQRQILQSLALIDAGQNVQAWADLSRCAAALDWQTHVPFYSPDPLED